MGGSEWSVATYGVVEYLRDHAFCRVLVAILGVIMVIAGVLSFSGIKLPGIGIAGFPFILIAPWLLWVATVSGPAFRLIFPAAQASNERREAEKQFEQSNTPEDALKLDLTRLNEYYVINQNQARSSFRWAIISMFIGFGTIIFGIWLFYFRATAPDKFMAGLSTAAGCVVNLISCLFLYLHSKTQERSLYYYEQLAGLQKLLLAIRLVDAHKDEATQKDARNLVIRELLDSSKAKDGQSLPLSTKT
jgi:hypothetical protein